MVPNHAFLTCMFIAWMRMHVDAQLTCSNGIVLYQRSPSNAVRIDVHADRSIEVATTEVPTAACQRVCDATPTCRSFSIDYTTRTCKIFSTTIPRTKLIQRPGAALFDKICLPNVSADGIRRRCAGRLWAVERVFGLALTAFVNRLQMDVSSSEACIQACLEEDDFICASATYDEVSRACSLSAEDRHTRPAAVSDNAQSSDYFENQCVNNLVDCQYDTQNNVRVVSADFVTTVQSEDDCRDECQKNTAITCRSYSYNEDQKSCSLSSDNILTLLGVDLPTQNGHRYAERQCHHSSGTSLSAIAAGNQIPFSREGFDALDVSRFPEIATVSNRQVQPGFGFGSSTPQDQTTRFNDFTGAGGNAGSAFFPQDRASFNPGFRNPNNAFFPGQGSSQTLDGRFSGGFGNPQDGNRNNPFFTGFPAASDSCSFEKSTGLTVMPNPQAIIPTGGVNRGVTVHCATLCRQQGPSQCPAFTVDYISGQCIALNRPATTALSFGSTSTQSYFEQVCYNSIYRACQGKTWSFERIINTELRGFDDRILPSIASRRDCEEACLKETQLPCLSAEYDGNRLECRLSRENRLTRPQALQQSPNVDYLENQCVPTSRTNACNLERQQGNAVFRVDTSISQVSTEDECKRICQTLPNFTCTAASYSQNSRDCLLSNDVTVFPQPGSILFSMSCLNPIQVAAPNFMDNGQSFAPNAFGNQFPASFGSPGIGGSQGNFGGFGGSGLPPAAFTPNQFQGNFNPTPNGFQQGPFFFNPNLNPTVPQQILPQPFGGGASSFPSQNPPFFSGRNPTFQNANPQFSGTANTNFPPNMNPQFTGTSNTNFPNVNPQTFATTGTSGFFPQQNPQTFGTTGTFGFVPQQNPQFFGAANNQFPLSTGSFSPSVFPPSSSGAMIFVPAAQFASSNPFGVQLIPSGIQQPQFSPAFGGRFTPNFQQRAPDSRNQNTRTANTSTSTSRRPDKQIQRVSQLSGTLLDTRRDDDYVDFGTRKPIRNAPRFLRAEPNVTTQNDTSSAA